MRTVVKCLGRRKAHAVDRMSATANQLSVSGPDEEYSITEEEREALEHLSEHGEYTGEIAERLLRLTD